MLISYPDLNLSGTWNITDGTDTPLPPAEGAIALGEPMVLAFAPAHPYRMMYAYRHVTDTVPPSITAIAASWRWRCPEFGGIALAQQYEHDLDLLTGGFQLNGGLAARFVGDHAGEWHVFDLVAQAWVATGVSLPPKPAWRAGVDVTINYNIVPSGIQFSTLIVNGVTSNLNRTMAKRPRQGSHLNIAVQLDAQAVPQQFALEVSNLKVAVITTSSSPA